MKLSETILLSIVVFLFVIGVHQTFINGFINSYWIFMLNIIFLSILRLVKGKNKADSAEEQPGTPIKRGKKNSKVKSR
jgi:hypothetical protein